MEAHVVARLPLEAQDPGRFQLGGRLVGPECERAHTLPTSAPFVARVVEGALLAEAVVVDPCFWTPDLPFLYRAKLELIRRLCARIVPMAMRDPGEDSLARYSRQMRYPPIGEEGQRRLLGSRALVVGCGALGSVIASTLARAEQSAAASAVR
jgi:hypothetical protein